jgi:hypothetical protein
MRCAALLFIFIALGAACDKSDSLPTAPSQSGDRATERFDDIINVREAKFRTFSVGSNGTTSINLASLSPLNRPGVIGATMEIGWGKVIKAEDGTVVGCDLAKVMQTTPALTAQLNDTLVPSVDYCANIADVGGLQEPANFSIRITHP